MGGGFKILFKMCHSVQAQGEKTVHACGQKRQEGQRDQELSGRIYEALGSDLAAALCSPQKQATY